MGSIAEDSDRCRNPGRVSAWGQHRSGGVEGSCAEHAKSEIRRDSKPGKKEDRPLPKPCGRLLRHVSHSVKPGWRPARFDVGAARGITWMYRIATRLAYGRGISRQHLNLPPGKSGRANIEAASWKADTNSVHLVSLGSGLVHLKCNMRPPV